MQKVKHVFCTLVIGIYFASCASIINGSRQRVPITSSPSGATVLVNDSVYGTTPMTLRMKRKKKEHNVTLKLDGYETYQMPLVRKVDAWIIGNIIFGGFIGLGIDALSGGMYHLTPDRVNGELKKK